MSRPTPAPVSAHRRPYRHGIAGLGLTEALLASLILSIGMVLLLKSQSSLRAHGDFARERAAAAVLAEAHVERLRARPPGDRMDSVDAVVDGTGTHGVSDSARDAASGGASDRAGDGAGGAVVGATERAVAAFGSTGPAKALDAEEGVEWHQDLDNSRYYFQQRIRPSGGGSLDDLNLQLRWQDRFGQWQVLRWPVRMGTVDPSMALLALSPQTSGDLARVAGRHAAIPASARELSPGWLVFQPDAGLSIAWLLNAYTGQVQGLCELGGRSVDDLRAADMADCKSRMAGGGALLLSGLIRFDLSDAPDPGAPHSSALPVGISLLLSEAAASPAPPHCASNAAGAVARKLAAVSYHCLVYPRARDQRWTGRSELSGVAADLRVYRVCRYSADHNRDGRIANIEHPALYQDVDGHLTQQNFLVIRAGRPCPSGLPEDPALGRLLDTGTVSHQPPT